jgi:SagB-type dehydrogenase family enzyme
MNKRIRLLLFAWVICASAGFAQERRPVKLPPPRTDGGQPLMRALKDRQSTRSFSSREIPLQVLSDLLWAAGGINRPESGRRTAPSAHNWQEIDIYVVAPDGVFVYRPKDHALGPVLAEDIRALAGTQDFVKEAPLNLIYVADFARMSEGSEEEKAFYAAADTGFMAQNVYLYCASEGLVTVVRASVDKPAAARKLGLTPTQRITLAQTVGYPK